MVDAGIGIKLDYSTITKGELLKAIRKVLHDPRYVK
jgi:UDP:flavonoid glycosyltransferase YjiC (YdhE family)